MREDRDYKELINISSDLTECLDHAATHIQRFNILVSKMIEFSKKVKFHPEEIDIEFRGMLEQMGESVLLLGEDLTEIGLLSKKEAEKIMEINENNK